MPPKRSNCGRSTRINAQRRLNRSLQSQEERHSSQVQRQSRIQTSRVQRNSLSSLRNQVERLRLSQRRQQVAQNRVQTFNQLAFHYDPAQDYSSDPRISIGSMNQVCSYCKALKFPNESKGMCCAEGKVKLSPIQEPPEPLKTLLQGNSPESNQFLKNIRKYNSCFQMTSFGADVVTAQFMPTFKVKGQIYHKAGSLLPVAGEDSKFLQLYFLGGGADELEARSGISNGVKRPIVAQLQEMLHNSNELIRLFKTTLEMMTTDTHKVVIQADKRPITEHARRYNAPTIDEVAIVIGGDQFQPRDIVLHKRNDRLTRVAETHRSYDALQYPLIFWDGADGYHFKIPMVNPVNGESTNKKCSSMNFYSYRIMVREHEENHILRCRQLFHQYIVDMYAKIESERLLFIKLNQTKLRSEEYIHLRDAVQNENVDNVGRLTILPSSFTGSPRHMREYAQDSMAYVRLYGRPDLFITLTCNPTWDEIKQHLLPGQKAIDRHDITARVFKQKLKTLMDFIVKSQVFRAVRCWMYSVEWQKRGLPHAHILIWLCDKISPTEIDNVISAEIPDLNIDKGLHDIVVQNMIHGPCGQSNPNSPCMVEGKCTKRYPRPYMPETVTGEDGYPSYRRRSIEDGGNSATLRNNVTVDNSWVVPYSPLLSKTFKAHINVEYCNSVKSIKYICKYVNKGSDMAVFEVQSNRNDEIAMYQAGRYISSNEAVWRILSFPIHERFPAVTHLSVHLENGQRVYFTTANVSNIAANPPNTTLTAFFALCQTDTFARTLLYSEVPSFYTWNASSKSFQRRKRGEPVENQPGIFKDQAIGRIYTIDPRHDECFFLRLLLVNVRGPTSFADLKNVASIEHPTYRSACQALGLLESDRHWEECVSDACSTSRPHQIRSLFAIILTTCAPSNPAQIWQNYKSFMADDILHRFRQSTGNMSLELSEEIYNQVLVLIEDLCLAIASKLLCNLGMPSPIRSAAISCDVDLLREQSYNVPDLQSYVQLNSPLMTTEQKFVYDQVLRAINQGNGGLYFLDAPGGTGKTFLLKLIMAQVRSSESVVLAMASSGIAATLLPGGRTAHSALKLPLNMHTMETPVCNISRSSGMGKVLQTCKLIVWDECTMAHKKSLEALNRTLQDLRRNSHPFGNAVVLLAGDFRQTLPVIPRSTPADEINACLKNTPLWKAVTTLRLTTNMRVHLQNDSSAALFSRQLLDIGNGTEPTDPQSGRIRLPQNFCNLVFSKEELISSVFKNIESNYFNHSWLSNRAILAATNRDVHQLNTTIQSLLPGETVSYKSFDTVVEQDEAVNFTTEFLNSQEVPGMPPHLLQLKLGSTIMVLRNIDQPKLCNGTRLAVKRLMANVIEGTILTGPYRGEDVLIPRIPMITMDLSFQFKRLQFPVRLAFAMTINKAQGQTLQVCGLDLEADCFAHGQLYVACSRVGKPQSLFVLTGNDNTAKNVVYRQVL